jgi:pyruvate/2-oxoglutarate dehydrogenase complex dihydrolipoamide acyltransferase (E2) component
LANIQELREILEGVRASGEFAVYPQPERSTGTASSLDAIDPALTAAPTASTAPSPAVATTPRTATPGTPAKRPRLDVLSSPLVRVQAQSQGDVYRRERGTGPQARLAASIEMYATEAKDANSKTQRAVAKIARLYKGKEGWSQRDVITAYEVMENKSKAETFLALEEDEEEEQWLWRQVDRATL